MKEIKLIAEIGWNHMGSIPLAEKMIKAAKRSGADYAKFQTWSVKNLKPGPWDNDGRRQIYEKAELDKEDYSKLSKICKKYKIRFLTSLFNHKDYKLISHLKSSTIKIPSPENRNKDLLKFVSNKYKNIFLSTGAAKISEIKKSVKYLNKNQVTIMHCVSAYPCDDKNVDLSRISIDLFKLARPKDYNIHAAITDFDGETQFFENGMINQQNTLENNGTNLKKIKINAFKLQTLLEKLNIDNIDFLNIDAEGSDYKVISSLDLNKIRPKMICIEENNYNIKDVINGAIQNLMNSNDYFLFSRIGVSSVYIENNFKGEIKNIINIKN